MATDPTTGNPLPIPITAHPMNPLHSPFETGFCRGSPSSANALVYIGGLTSGPFTSEELLQPLFAAIEDAGLNYSVWEFRARGSYSGFGFHSLQTDVEDLRAMVAYLNGLGVERVVLCGSSTGCQTIMTFVSTTNIPHIPQQAVDAYILQAPTSDRETGSLLMEPEFFARSLKYAEGLIKEGKKEEIMPREMIPPIFHSPITAYRWHSLIAKGGDDDFFSSDLPDAYLASTFGKVDKPILILPSEKDEMGPPTVDKQALLQRWIDGCPADVVDGRSALNPGADHGLSVQGAREWFVERVVGFLGEVGEGKSGLVVSVDVK